MSKPEWYESSDNVLELAKYAKNKAMHGHLAGEESNRLVWRIIDNPKNFESKWKEYQASLKPVEPKLSEILHAFGLDIYCQGNLDRVIRTKMKELVDGCERIAQRLEALEEKMGEQNGSATTRN